MSYQTAKQLNECEEREHIAECNRFFNARHSNYCTLHNGDVVEFGGIQKTVEREIVSGFFVKVVFTDGSEIDKISLFFDNEAKRVNHKNNLAGVFSV